MKARLHREGQASRLELRPVCLCSKRANPQKDTAVTSPGERTAVSPSDCFHVLLKSDSKSPIKTEGGHSLKASSRVKERGQAVNHCWERVELGSLSLWDSAGDTWGVCLWPWLKGEHSQGDDVSQAAFLSQVQGKRKTIVFNQIEV